MRFGFVPSDLLRSRASFIAFSFRPSREPRKHRLSSLCAAQRSLYSAETTPKQQREEFPLGSQAIGLCSAPRCRSRRIEEHKLSICAAPIRQKSPNRSYICSESSLLRTEPNCSGKTNLGRRNDMRMPFCLLALLGLAGCVAETPVTTTTTEVTRTVTTGPVATQPVTREVLVTQAPPPVRVETRTVAPGPSYVWTNGYWQWTGASYAWVPGHWIVRPRPAAVWVEGHWVRRPGGWIWVAGHWQ
jgi:hypothetical protein